MSTFSTVKGNYYNNPLGVMDYIMTFALQEKILSNTRLYFYKYNLKDLIEISFKGDHICCFIFNNDLSCCNFIKNDLEFFVNYFKAGGLHESRFLFNLSFKTPVSYTDFVEFEKLPNSYEKEFLFVLDNKKEVYVKGDKAALLFVATDRTPSVDKCVLSFMNNSINVTDPKTVTFEGGFSSCVLSGLLDGLSFDSIESDLDVVEPNYKFVRCINGLDYSSGEMIRRKSKLNTAKFLRIVNKQETKAIEGEIVKNSSVVGAVSLLDLLETGLDKFIKFIDVDKSDVKMNVIVDVMQQAIQSAYILNGILYIEPFIATDISFFKEFMDSDNVEFIKK